MKIIQEIFNIFQINIWNEVPDKINMAGKSYFSIPFFVFVSKDILILSKSKIFITQISLMKKKI